MFMFDKTTPEIGSHGFSEAFIDTVGKRDSNKASGFMKESARREKKCEIAIKISLCEKSVQKFP